MNRRPVPPCCPPPHQCNGGFDHIITFLLSEIKYDVKFDSWLKSKVINREIHNANPQSEKVGYAYDDDKAEDWLVRQIDTAINNVKAELAWAVVEPERTDTDEILTNPDKWHLHLHFSPNWRGKITALKSAVHTYITDYVLSRWYRAARPQEAAQYEASAELAINKAYNEARSEMVVYKPWTL